MTKTKIILPIIVFSQFCCTSLWFATNSIIKDLITNYNLPVNSLSHLTSIVQFGFIIGTLFFAIFTIADRFSPSKVFFTCAIIGAILNSFLIWENNTLTSLLIIRFFNGFFLAGIYPIGMKIATDYYQKGLGKSLGYLVGALVLGTAFPHLLTGIGNVFLWKNVVYITSGLTFLGGLLMLLFVPNGPYRKQVSNVDLYAFLKIFKNVKFKNAAFGYFGHMWELYAFWTFVPILLKSYHSIYPETSLNISLLSFFIIGIGSLACIASGYISEKKGVKRTASLSLFLSCICCLLCPIIFTINNSFLFILFLLFWGIVVIADSPLLSTLVSKNATSEIRGTALTIVNCIGFFITIISIQLLSFLIETIDSNIIYITLAIGPIISLIALKNKKVSFN